MAIEKTFELLEEKERISPEERTSYLAEGLRRMCQYAYNNSSAWKKRFDDVGVNPSNIASLQDLEKKSDAEYPSPSFSDRYSKAKNAQRVVVPDNPIASR